jgi:hypothetical protein
MHAIDRNMKIRIGVMVAIFATAAGCMLIVLRTIVSSGPPAVAVRAQGQPAGALPPFRMAAAGRHANAVARAKTIRPDQHDPIKQQFHPATVTVSMPRTMWVGHPGRVTLAIEPGGAASGDLSLPRGMDRLVPVSTDATGDQTIRTYRTLVSDTMTSQLYEPAADVTHTSHEDKKLAVPQEGVRWIWDLPVSERGMRGLELELLGEVKIETAPETWPIGTLAFQIPVEATFGQGLISYLEEIGRLEQGLVLFVSGLVTVIGAWPVVRKLWPVASRHKDAPNAQAPT